MAYCAKIYHFRTPKGNHEVDFVVTLGDVVLAIEVKLSHEVSDRDTVHMHWLADMLSSDKICVKAIVNTGAFAYCRPDGVFVIPFGLLGI